ncbi:integrase catalytic domain-containing protein [Trichonephila clavipes]|nr:integrase catalytic domain-containing protein [Trichonephila clavipes]
MFKGAKKEDLRRIASELELCVSDKVTVLDLMDLIKNCDRYKNDPDSVHELANLIIEERKYDESQQLELEKIREKSKLDLEIARIRANDKDNNTENTVFGYIASGSIPVSSENKPHCGLIKDNVDLDKTMRRFWEIENVEPETIKNKETIICEEHFQKNHTRDSTGRYIVSMPFKKDPNCLGQSKDIALKKLNFLWNRLKREPNYLKLYRDFLKEYKELGHMQEVDEREECGMYFIPHLGAYRSDKNK